MIRNIKYNNRNTPTLTYEVDGDINTVETGNTVMLQEIMLILVRSQANENKSKQYRRIVYTNKHL